MPEVISSFSLGNAANSARGNGVRSRIAQMISKSFSALAAASVEANGSLNTVMSTRSLSGDQSATFGGEIEVVVGNCTAQPRHGEVHPVGGDGAETAASGWAMVARNARARKRRRRLNTASRSGRMQVRGGDVLGAPGRTRAAHVMLFRPVGMERRDDELMPELADFADQSGLAIVALCRRRRGR